MMAKKKKRHGGLKFMAFVVVMVVLIIAISKGSKTEIGQRITGNRDDHRLENTRLTPRFGFAAAKVRTTVGAIFNIDGTMLDATTTSDVSIDRESSTSSSEIVTGATATEIAPGVDATPYDTFTDIWTQIMTKDYRYVSPRNEGEPWTRFAVDPWFYGTEIDEHYIPMIDDLMGYELRAIPSKPITAEPVAGLKRDSLTRPAVDAPTRPSAVIKTYSYEFDMETYRRVLPILARRTHLFALRETMVTVTIGFDDVGLLRFADVSIPTSVATTLAQQLGTYQSAEYHYTLEVTDISGEPIKIDLPTNVVDQEAEPAPTDTAPADPVAVVP
jgi:hypothetical protein